MRALLLALMVCSSTAHQPTFLNKIFHLYGDDQRLTFEGLEHLMESLGLGRLKFDKSHNVSVHRTEGGQFEEVHDRLHLHQHDHLPEEEHPDPDHRPSTDTRPPDLLRTRRALQQHLNASEEECLSPGELLSLYDLGTSHQVSISPKTFTNICPAIVYMLDRRACSPLLTPPAPHPPAALNEWVGAGLSILVISVVGLAGVSVVPLVGKARLGQLLTGLVALAVGSLCGDALLHLVPHALGVEDSVDAAGKGTIAFMFLVVFFIMETVIHGKHAQKEAKEKLQKGDYLEVNQTKNQGGHCHAEGDKATAWSVVVGDALHNLTDGLAVGAAFRGDPAAGVATAVAVLAHELPHELGDFAVLLESGVSTRKALLYNVLSSVASAGGAAAGLLLAGLGSLAPWLHAATAGSFLYIGLVTLVPELHKQTAKGGLRTCLVQVGGMLLGAGIMLLIALYEHDLHHLLSS